MTFNRESIVATRLPLPAGDPRALADTREEHLHAILGERDTGLRQEEVVFARAAPLGQFLLARSMPIQVVEQVAQAVGTQRDAALLRPLRFDGDEAMSAVEVREP